MLGVILFRLSENSFLMDDISEKIFKKELNKLFLVKIRIREDYTWLSTTWRSRIWNEEILNTHDSSHSVSLSLKGDTSWKPTNGQIKLHERAYTCGADWGWRTIFIKRAMQEVAEKLKNWKDAAIRKKYKKNNEDWKNFLRSMIRNHEQWVYSSTMLAYWAVMTYLVPHQALITSSSRKPSRDVGMLRNTPEDMSFPGNVFDRQHAQRNSDELHNDSKNLAISLAIKRTEGLENSGSEEPLQSIHLPCFSVRTRRRSLDDK